MFSNLSSTCQQSLPGFFGHRKISAVVGFLMPCAHTSEKNYSGGNFARRIIVMNSRLEIPWNPAARPDTSMDGIISRGCVRGIILPLPEMSFPSSCACQHTSCAVGRFSSQPPQKNLHLMMQVWAKQQKDWLIHSLIPVVVRLSRSDSEIFRSSSLSLREK